MKNNKKLSYFEFNSPIGCISIEDNSYAITALHFLKNKTAENLTAPSAIADNATKQLKEYFCGIRRNFDLPLLLNGTYFQKQVWSELLKIPYGEVCSYKDIAVRIGKANAYRAIGGANNKNPIPIIVPCHRVIGSNGKLIGYSGGLDIKKYLIKLEKDNIR